MKGGFRSSACAAGCPTIIMEGGEVWKVEPAIVETAIRGVVNVLRHLKMVDGDAISPPFQVKLETTKWIRANYGGFLQFHVQPGDLVMKDQPLATNTTLLGDDQNQVLAPFNAVVLGMTSLPAVSPGEPICHLGKLPRGKAPHQLTQLRLDRDGLEQRVSEDLASSVMVVEPAPPSTS